jgi:hypothetical protein
MDTETKSVQIINNLRQRESDRDEGLDRRVYLPIGLLSVAKIIIHLSSIIDPVHIIIRAGSMIDERNMGMQNRYCQGKTDVL